MSYRYRYKPVRHTIKGYEGELVQYWAQSLLLGAVGSTPFGGMAVPSGDR